MFRKLISPGIVFLFPLLLASCAEMYVHDDEDGGYRGVAYEKAALAANRERYTYQAPSRSYGSSSSSSRRYADDDAPYIEGHRTTRTINGYKVSDTSGNWVRSSPGFNGSTRYTTSSGTTYTGSEGFNGTYRLSGSNGTTYTGQETLDGGYRFRGSDGSTHTFNPTLRGYRHSSY